MLRARYSGRARADERASIGERRELDELIARAQSLDGLRARGTDADAAGEPPPVVAAEQRSEREAQQNSFPICLASAATSAAF